MTCYKPLHAIKSSAGLIFDPRNAQLFAQGLPLIKHPTGENIQLPCGSCIGCRLDHSKMWGTRCAHEASLFENNCFLTLTYADEHLSPNLSLNKEDITRFLKRLRKRFVPKIPVEYKDDKEFLEFYNFSHGIRYYQCGEYGELLSRPHHHVLLFNFDFFDKVFFKKTRKGFNLYTSVLLDELWRYGHCFIGDVSYQSAAYVARYCVKKITGYLADAHYGDRQPEYATMSRSPGIGKYWYDVNKKEVYPSDFTVMDNGCKVKPPKYYDSKFEADYFDDFELLKMSRKSMIRSDDPNRSCRRLQDREKVKKAQCKSLDRM